MSASKDLPRPPAELNQRPERVKATPPAKAGAASAASSLPVPLGTTLEDFELQSVLGQGSTGVVYKARQRSLDRPVALKILVPEHFQSAPFLTRFLADERATTALVHTNIVRIHHVGMCAAGPYYAMELVDGQALEILIRGRALPLYWAVSLMVRVSEAVHHAHTRGIIHGSLKPGNILIERQQRPVVTDFCLAGASRGAVANDRNVVVGACEYSAPEQVRAGAAPAGPLSDIYALGAILYAVLTGRPPFLGQTLAATLARIASHEPPAPLRTLRPDVPEQLERVCLRCLSKRPEDRYATGHDFANALRPLRAALREHQPKAPPRPAPVATPPVSSHRAALLAVVEGPDRGLMLLVLPGENLMLGRSQATDCGLTDPRLARAHCNLRFDAEGVALEDLKSDTGTFVNSQSAATARLKVGDVIRIGDTHLRLLDPEAAPADLSTIAADDDPRPAAEAPAGPGGEVNFQNESLLDVEYSAWPTRLCDLVGSTFAHYEIGPALARGASGMVFRGHDLKGSRDVVLKVLKPSLAGDEVRRRCFLRTITSATWNHPNLVRMYEAGRTGPYCWQAVEPVEGEGLKRLLQRAGDHGRLDWRLVLRIALDLARGLEHAHGHHLLHGNITPANVLVHGRDGAAKLNDLMLAKALGELYPDQAPCPTETVADLAYLAPEQTLYEGKVDGRADIYGLGAVLYHALTGSPPFEAETRDEMLANLAQKFPRRPSRYVPSVPAPVESLVLALMDKDPDKRVRSPVDLQKELERIAKVLRISQ